MAQFAYNNTKNTSMRYMSFKLNCEYQLYISYKKNVNYHFKSKVLINWLKNLEIS